MTILFYALVGIWLGLSNALLYENINDCAPLFLGLAQYFFVLSFAEYREYLKNR